MKTAVINIKIDAKTKKKAQKLAQEMGLSLSAVINGFLSTFVKNRAVSFGFGRPEEPTEYLIKALNEAKEDEKKKRMSPAFNKAEDAVRWLKKEVRKYAD